MFTIGTTIIMANLVLFMSEMCAFKDYRLYALSLAAQLLATNWLRLTGRASNYDRFCVRVVFLASIVGSVSYTYGYFVFALHLAVSLLVVPDNRKDIVC